MRLACAMLLQLLMDREALEDVAHRAEQRLDLAIEEVGTDAQQSLMHSSLSTNHFSLNQPLRQAAHVRSYIAWRCDPPHPSIQGHELLTRTLPPLTTTTKSREQLLSDKSQSEEEAEAERKVGFDRNRFAQYISDRISMVRLCYLAGAARLCCIFFFFPFFSFLGPPSIAITWCCRRDIGGRSHPRHDTLGGASQIAYVAGKRRGRHSPDRI